MGSADWSGRARDAAAALQRRYRPEAGVWGECWWQSANALEAIIDYMAIAGSGEYVEVIASTFAGAQDQATDFLNKYYDDEGWWAIAFLKAFDLTAQAEYLDLARRIFADMATGWDDTFGGGVWWTKERGYKNAIPNELFLVLSARLAQRVDGTAGEEYLDWAQREWQWFGDSGMINEEGLVNDGLDREGGNNGGITWTYNQGVILGGLAELHRATGDPSLLKQAERITAAAIAHLCYPNGVLCEPRERENACDGDQEVFKGIFVRYLAALNGVLGRPELGRFIGLNADSLWRNARSEEGEFDLCWNGPFDHSSVQRQVAGLDLLNAAALSCQQLPELSQNPPQSVEGEGPVE